MNSEYAIHILHIMIIIFDINFNSEFILVYFVPIPNCGTRTTNDTYAKSHMLASGQSNDFDMRGGGV